MENQKWVENSSLNKESKSKMGVITIELKESEIQMIKEGHDLSFEKDGISLILKTAKENPYI